MRALLPFLSSIFSFDFGFSLCLFFCSTVLFFSPLFLFAQFFFYSIFAFAISQRNSIWNRTASPDSTLCISYVSICHLLLLISTNLMDIFSAHYLSKPLYLDRMYQHRRMQHLMVS